VEELSNVSRELDVGKIEAVLESIYNDLFPLYQSEAVLKASEKDGYTTSLERLRAELETVNQYFGYTRRSILKGN
jgi:cob(I)alamin adenosyltransferase